ncbi:DsbA family protein [Granulosicoccaceae sp. 1_MG-2023]|nr:DsbA family protein [Granulosicoccaceae sp. 1_MG-2023]
MIATLYYVHDPMCSWCWAFRPVWDEVRRQLPDGVEVQYLLGGLAPDSDEPMPAEMQTHLQAVWRHISRVVPGTQFNFDFWRLNTPRRSTYPACRAVIAAQTLRPDDGATAMTQAIQQAYYQDALNPSDDEVLISLAVANGLDRDAFAALLNAPETQNRLLDDIRQHQRLGARGFPSLILVKDKQAIFIEHSYTSAEQTLAAIVTAL